MYTLREVFLRLKARYPSGEAEEKEFMKRVKDMFQKMKSVKMMFRGSPRWAKSMHFDGEPRAYAFKDASDYEMFVRAMSCEAENEDYLLGATNG